MPLIWSIITERGVSRFNNAAFVPAVFGPLVRRFTNFVAKIHARLASGDVLNLSG
jgi:hypothetical protein